MFAEYGLEIAAEHRSKEMLFPFSPSDREMILAELERLLESHYFSASRRCSSFLKFIVAEMLEGNADELKERSLGAALFNRKPGYDTNADPVVRVTAGEVRKRLSQYYQGSATAMIRFALPVGSYAPRFEFVRSSTGTFLSDSDDSGGALGALRSEKLLEPARVSAAKSLQTNRRLWVWLYPQIAVALAAILLLLGWRERVIAKSIPEAVPPTSFATFWKPFTTSQAETLAVFAEMPRHPRPQDLPVLLPQPGARFENVASPGISGVGEVMGMHALDEDFKSLQLVMHAKRGSFFTFDDADGKNLIFLGSPLTNQPLQELPTTDFVFRVVKASSGKEVLAIVNDHPRPGEALQFLSTPAALPIESDYAIIALMPGVGSTKHILLLAGITTFGTEAAAEFVSREDCLKTLLPRLRFSNNGEIPPFEALIKVTIKDEVPVRMQVVAVHPGVA